MVKQNFVVRWHVALLLLCIATEAYSYPGQTIGSYSPLFCKLPNQEYEMTSYTATEEWYSCKPTSLGVSCAQKMYNQAFKGLLTLSNMGINRELNFADHAGLDQSLIQGTTIDDFFDITLGRSMIREEMVCIYVVDAFAAKKTNETKTLFQNRLRNSILKDFRLEATTDSSTPGQISVIIDLPEKFPFNSGLGMAPSLHLGESTVFPESWINPLKCVQSAEEKSIEARLEEYLNTPQDDLRLMLTITLSMLESYTPTVTGTPTDLWSTLFKVKLISCENQDTRLEYQIPFMIHAQNTVFVESAPWPIVEDPGTTPALATYCEGPAEHCQESTVAIENASLTTGDEIHVALKLLDSNVASTAQTSGDDCSIQLLLFDADDNILPSNVTVRPEPNTSCLKLTLIFHEEIIVDHISLTVTLDASSSPFSGGAHRRALESEKPNKVWSYFSKVTVEASQASDKSSNDSGDDDSSSQLWLFTGLAVIFVGLGCCFAVAYVCKLRKTGQIGFTDISQNISQTESDSSMKVQHSDETSLSKIQTQDS